ncbi:XRE family transcriptional regulator [Actinomadura graeca]|nr:XRE family transcriptional regulator [Actinomadura graeca]
MSDVVNTLDAPPDLTDWEKAVEEYHHTIDTQPWGAFIPDLTADIIAVGGILSRKRYPPAAQADLLRVSARLSALLAVQFDDVGQRRAARTSWDVARRAAHASGDRNLLAWVIGREAKVALWTSRADDAITSLADRVTHLAGEKPSAPAAMAGITQLTLAARKRDGAATQAAVQRLSETAESGATSEWVLRWWEAYAYALTNDPRAGAILDRALALSPPNALVPVVNLQVIRALVLVRQGTSGEGLRHALASLDGAKPNTTQRRLAAELLAMLPSQDRRLPEARDVRALAAGLTV